MSATEPARVLRNVFFAGQPLPVHVATSVAPTGIPVTLSRVDLAVVWAKNASVIVTSGGDVESEPPDEPEEPEEPPPGGEP